MIGQGPSPAILSSSLLPTSPDMRVSADRSHVRSPVVGACAMSDGVLCDTFYRLRALRVSAAARRRGSVSSVLLCLADSGGPHLLIRKWASSGPPNPSRPTQDAKAIPSGCFAGEKSSDRSRYSRSGNFPCRPSAVSIERAACAPVGWAAMPGRVDPRWASAAIVNLGAGWDLRGLGGDGNPSPADRRQAKKG